MGHDVAQLKRVITVELAATVQTVLFGCCNQSWLLPRQYSFGTTLRFTGPVPADSQQ